MPNPQRYPFVAADSALGEASLRPYLPVALTYQSQTTVTAGLLDTGAAVNVLPFRIGIELGAVWEHQTTILQLTGNLAHMKRACCLSLPSLSHFHLSDSPLRGQKRDMYHSCLAKLTSFWNSTFVSIVRY